jgi:hypothetical protein
MFSWRSTPQPALAPVSLHDTLVRNTMNYRTQLPEHIKKVADTTYPVIRDAVIKHSCNNANNLFIFSTGVYIHGQGPDTELPDLANLTYEERDKVLEHVKERFVAEGVECHVDGTCIKIIWRLPENTQ